MSTEGWQLANFDLSRFVRETLDEDLGLGLPDGGHDVTAESVIPADARFSGTMESRDAIVVAGLPVAAAFFRALDPAIHIDIIAEEGSEAETGAELMRLAGNARAMLTAERSALNTVQHLSGIATLTRRYVRAMGETRCVLLDTRKTLPRLRVLEKYATRLGGARNYRMGLWDAAMIKDNHVLVAGDVGEAVRRAREAGIGQVICEVDRLEQIEPAIAAGAAHILLDNMNPETLHQAVALVDGRAATEASGGVTLDSIGAIARTGVDFVSVGRITQSAAAADIGLDFTPA